MNLELNALHFECFMNATNDNALNASFLYAHLLGHSAVRQMDLRRAIRLSHPELVHYNKRAKIVHDM